LLTDEIAPGSAPKLLGWPVRKLRALGIETEVIAVIDKGYQEKYKELYEYHLSGVPIRYLFPRFPRLIQKLNFRFPGMSFFSLHHIASWLWSWRGIKKDEFDFIIAYCQYTGLAARNIKSHHGIPYALLIWDPSTFTARKIYKNRFGWRYPVLYAFAWLLDRLAMQGPSAIITSGSFHHGHLRTITDKPIEVLVPGCFVREKIPDFSLRKRVILTYDRWDIGNIPNIFLDILERLSHKDVQLTIGGFWHPESLRDIFERDVQRRGLQKRVKLLGPLDEALIMKLCSESFVHIHPVHEAFGMQTLEAAACACPVIIPRGSGVADLFEHGVHGYFPESGNLDEMVRYTERIFTDTEKTKEMGIKAWERAKAYDWEHHAQTLYAICKKYMAVK
jgi:glycosyltransferase involved in cell wall biosynthesis